MLKDSRRKVDLSEALVASWLVDCVLSELFFGGRLSPMNNGLARPGGSVIYLLTSSRYPCLARSQTDALAQRKTKQL